MPYEIKKLVAAKRRASSIWQRTDTPDSRRTCSRKSNQLKSKLEEMRNESCDKYVSNLKRQDNSLWKLIKNKRKPKTSSPQYTNIQHFRDHGENSTREKLNYLQKIFPKFSPHMMKTRIRKCNKT
jgi:hypothetical protein